MAALPLQASAVSRVPAPRAFWKDGSSTRVTEGRSLLLSLRNVYETLHVSAPTVADALAGTITREACDARLERWASRVIANTEAMISVHGREHLPRWGLRPLSPHRPPGETSTAGASATIVMSNHQSHYDVAVLYYVLGASLRMIAKRELFELPVFGRALHAAGFVSVDRKNHERAVASLAAARALLASGVPIWIAPEGTRSPDGELLPFKKGGFHLALATATPVLPVSIRGTRDILPAKGVRSRRGVEVFVTIHPLVDVARYAAMQDPRAARDALAAEVRAAIASGL
jgi:1-acyl-sn-glycerol-3-phosphate acyltransferase